MPEQILLQGKILGTEEFLLAGSAGGRSARSAGEDTVWPAGPSGSPSSAKLCPARFWPNWGLARILLGSSGGGQFLIVLPGEAREPAERFLTAAARQMREMSGGCVRLDLGLHG